MALTLNMAEPGEILALRHESVVVRDGDEVYKSYLPHEFPEWQQKYGQIPLSPTYSGDQTQLFNHEYAIVKAFSSLDERVAPPFLRAEKDSLRLCFQYQDYPLYQDEFMKNWADPSRSYSEKLRVADSLTEEIVLEVLVPFHIYANANIGKLVAASKVFRGDLQPIAPRSRLREKVMLRMRHPDGRVGRISNSFKAIMYSRSQGLADYWYDHGINPDECTEKEIRRHIAAFAKRYRFHPQVRKIEARDRRINQREAKFVDGDFRPQNIFRTGDSSNILIFDFDKSRRGSSTVDLCHAINTMHRFPFHPDKEAFSLYLVGEYFKRTGTPQKALALNVARFPPSALLQELRWWAYHCEPVGIETPPTQIKSYIGDRHFLEAENEEDLRTEMVDTHFPKHLIDMLKYYRFREGEGWEEVIERPLLSTEGLDAPTKRARRDFLNDVKEQVSDIEGILKDTGCLHGQASNLNRAQRIRQIFKLK